MVNRWDTNNGWMTIRALSFWPGQAPINGLPRHIISHRIPIRSGQVSQLMKNRKQSTNHHYLYTLVTTVIMAHRLAYRNVLIRVLQSMVQIFLYLLECDSVLWFFFIHQLTYQSSRDKNGNCLLQLIRRLSFGGIPSRTILQTLQNNVDIAIYAKRRRLDDFRSSVPNSDIASVHHRMTDMIFWFVYVTRTQAQPLGQVSHMCTNNIWQSFREYLGTCFLCWTELALPT